MAQIEKQIVSSQKFLAGLTSLPHYAELRTDCGAARFSGAKGRAARQCVVSEASPRVSASVRGMLG